MIIGFITLERYCSTNVTYTLVYRIEVQAQIKVQVGEFLKIDKRSGLTSCKKSINLQELIDVQ